MKGYKRSSIKKRPLTRITTTLFHEEIQRREKNDHSIRKTRGL